MATRSWCFNTLLEDSGDTQTKENPQPETVSRRNHSRTSLSNWPAAAMLPQIFFESFPRYRGRLKTYENMQNMHLPKSKCFPKLKPQQNHIQEISEISRTHPIAGLRLKPNARCHCAPKYSAKNVCSSKVQSSTTIRAGSVTGRTGGLRTVRQNNIK